MAEVFYFHVQEDRSIKYKLPEPIMQEDKDVAVWRFRIPKVLNNIDMSAWSWWFVYVNAKGQKFSELLTLNNDIDDPEEYSIADYSIGYGISKTPGGFTFALEAISTSQGGEISGEWHTRTYSHKVDKTLQGNQAEYAETESDIISALMQEVRNKVNQLVGGATPLPVNLKSLMTDHDKVYLYTGSEDGESTGYWYHYNGSNFVPGGLYGAGVQIDPTLTQSGQAADAKVIGDWMREYESIFEGDVEESVQNWLDEHPEATTTVQDGSITEAKLSEALKLKTIKDYVTPEMYGAVGDGVTDDTVSIQNAVDNGNPVIFEYGKSYLITSSILLEDNTIINGNNATILNHGICTAIRKKNSTIKNVIIEKLKITGIGKDDTSGLWPDINSAIIIATNAKNIKIRDCEFTDFRYGVFIGGQEGENAIIDNCKFIDCKDAIDTFVSENGIISNCEFYNCYVPIQLETNTDVFTNNFRIFNNKTIGTISDTSLNMHSRIIDIEVFSNVFDKKTICTGVNVENLSVFDNVLGDKNVFSGKTKISNNIINGATYLETNFDGVVIGNYIESSTYAFQTTSDAKFINNVAKVGTAFLVNGGTIAYIIGLRLLSGQIVSNINYDEIVFFDYCGTATVSYAGIIKKLSAAYKYYNPTNS